MYGEVAVPRDSCRGIVRWEGERRGLTFAVDADACPFLERMVVVCHLNACWRADDELSVTRRKSTSSAESMSLAARIDLHPLPLRLAAAGAKV
jgi:hypothetical protein